MPNLIPLWWCSKTSYQLNITAIYLVKQGLLASLGTLIDDVGNDDSRLLAHYVQRSDTQRLAQQQWNQTDTHYPLQTALETTVLDDIINQCRQNPRSIALHEVLLVHSDLLDIALQLATTVCTTYARKLVIQTLDDHFDNLHRFGGEPLLTSPEPHDCAYVIYTSGSTGEPKGVEVPHLGLKNRLCWQQQAFNLQADDVVLHKTPYNFDVSVWELLWPLMIGAKLVIALPNAHKDPAAIAHLCQQTRVNVMHFVPSMLQVFIDEAELELPDLTLLICSGEALLASLAQKTLKQLPHTALYNLYGPTEASIDVSYYQCQADDESWQIPIGKPIANTCLYILDQQHNPLPSGAIGELYIAGSGLASGYLNRPQLNYERFIKAEIDGKVQRLYRTGDLARWRMDGELEYLGRCDSQIKLRGLRIELAEIEALLSRHNAIEQAVVLAVPQEQPEYLQACVTLNENGRHLSQTDILQTLAEQLPDYMVPSSLVVVDKMPTNANGKTDRKQLAKITLALADNTFEQLDSNNRQSPKTDLEYSLVKLLSDMLKQPKVMLQDDLFTLGAHSLWLVKLQRQLLKHFGVQVPLNQLMSHKKVCQLVDLIANTPTQHVENDLMPLVQCEQKDAPTLYCIHPGSGLSSRLPMG
ncbi:MAG: amino acid adenylation domain-containing protein [Paraglaciecola sp.]|jgi:amino acid adenylation domain-containing protein